MSLVVTDVPASPSPCSLISPRKPHQRTLPYLWDEALNVPYRTLAGASVARLVRPALSALRDENLCIIRALESLIDSCKLIILTFDNFCYFVKSLTEGTNVVPHQSLEKVSSLL